MRQLVTLACQECKRRNYHTNKNKKNDPDRIELKKYCPLVRYAHGPQGDALASTLLVGL